MAASGLTYLQIVNEVLKRLREATVATISETTYSAFIGSLVNQVKSEIEDAYYWNPLRDTYSVQTVADGTTSYNLTGAGQNAVILDGWNTTTPVELTRGTNRQFNEWFFGVTSANIQTGPTTHFIPSGVGTAYDLKVDVWPKPDAVYALKFTVYVPQADLSNAIDVPLVPQTVLIEETIARALNERGDEDAPKPAPGDTFIKRELLNSAIAREAGHDDSEMDWEPE